MKKLFGKTVLYLFVLILLPYLFFLWQAKQGVDTFLLSHSFGAEIRYQWLGIDLNGRIYLYDVEALKDSRNPVVKAEYVTITPDSIFDLVNAREHVLYSEYPTAINVSIHNAFSEQGDKLFSLLGAEYNPELVSSFYPLECSNSLKTDINHLNFNISSSFNIHRTSDISNVEFEFKSIGVASITGKFRINNFSEGNSDGSFVSDLSIGLTDLAWLQQNTQRCLDELKTDKLDFTHRLAKQIILNAKSKKLVLEQSLPKTIAEFLYVPQSIGLNFDVEEGKKLSQVQIEPLYELPEKLGLAIKLNQIPVNVIFDQLMSSEIRLEKNEEEISKIELVRKPIIDPKVKIKDLPNHLGAKLHLTLNNGKSLEGYLESMDQQFLSLLQRKYGGRTIITIDFKSIKEITLIHTEN